MIFTPLSQEKLNEWREIHKNFKDKLTENRKSGSEVLEYLKSKYLLEELTDQKSLSVVSENVLNNAFYKQKLPENSQPEPKAFILKNEGNGKTIYDNQEDIWEDCPVFIGVDLISGYVHIEGSCLLYDEIFAFQGIDRYDLDNFVRVGEYIECIKKFSPKLYDTLCNELDS